MKDSSYHNMPANVLGYIYILYIYISQDPMTVLK